MRIVVELTQREADELMREGQGRRWLESEPSVARELEAARQKVRDGIIEAEAFAQAHP